MNRRGFLKGLFAILPSATLYNRIWVPNREIVVPQEICGAWTNEQTDLYHKLPFCLFYAEMEGHPRCKESRELLRSVYEKL